MSRSYDSEPKGAPVGMVMTLVVLTLGFGLGSGFLIAREDPDTMSALRAYKAECRDTLLRGDYHDIVCPNRRHTLRVLGPGSVVCECPRPAPASSGSVAP